MFHPTALSSTLQDRISSVDLGISVCLEDVDSVSSRVDDQELCRRLRGGEVGALQLLMGRHGSAVRKLAMNVLGDEAEAEDVAQDVFLTVWKHKDRWSDEGAKFSTWLHRVALNRAIDKRRSRRCRSEDPETMTRLCDAANAQQAVGAEQELALKAQQHAQMLRDAMRNLPANQARALIHVYLEERDAGSAAELMGLSEQAVRSLLKRGKQALRERLEEIGAGHDAERVQTPARQPRAGRG